MCNEIPNEPKEPDNEIPNEHDVRNEPNENYYDS